MTALRQRCLLAALAACPALGALAPTSAEAAIKTFTMIDVAVFSSAPPDVITATTGQQIPGGFDNTAAANEFHLSSLQFDIDGDFDPLGEDPTIYFDFQVRTASFVGGQVVFDGFTHVFPPAPQNGSFVMTSGANSYLNLPFVEGDLIGDGVDEFVRDGFSPPGPPNNQTFSVALDEEGVVRQFIEGVDNFVGFKLDTDDYGWIRVQFDATASTLTFLDGAYDDSGAPIAAGSTTGGGGGDNANFDGVNGVNGQDFLIWQRNLGRTGTGTLATGDANGDLNVAADDLAIWKQQFGASAVAATGMIPEPGTLVLAGMCLAALSRRRRQRTAQFHRRRLALV